MHRKVRNIQNKHDYLYILNKKNASTNRKEIVPLKSELTDDNPIARPIIEIKKENFEFDKRKMFKIKEYNKKYYNHLYKFKNNPEKTKQVSETHFMNYQHENNHFGGLSIYDKKFTIPEYSKFKYCERDRKKEYIEHLDQFERNQYHMNIDQVILNNIILKIESEVYFGKGYVSGIKNQENKQVIREKKEVDDNDKENFNFMNFIRCCNQKFSSFSDFYDHKEKFHQKEFNNSFSFSGFNKRLARMNENGLSPKTKYYCEFWNSQVEIDKEREIFNKLSALGKINNKEKARILTEMNIKRNSNLTSENSYSPDDFLDVIYLNNDDKLNNKKNMMINLESNKFIIKDNKNRNEFESKIQNGLPNIISPVNKKICLYEKDTICNQAQSLKIAVCDEKYDSESPDNKTYNSKQFISDGEDIMNEDKKSIVNDCNNNIKLTASLIYDNANNTSIETNDLLKENEEGLLSASSTLKIDHKNKENVSDPNNKKIRYVCTHPGCGNSYTSKAGFLYHLKDNHSKINEFKPFHCTIKGCMKKYKNSNGLKYHLQHGHC